MNFELDLKNYSEKMLRIEAEQKEKEDDIELDGEYRLRGRVDQEMADAFIAFHSKQTEPYTLAISSYGGDAYAGLDMAIAMKENPVHVTAKAGAIVASAATLPFFRAQTRQVHAETNLLLHRSRFMVYGTEKDLIEAAGELNLVDESMTAIYREAGIPEEAIAAYYDRDTIVSAKDFLDMKVVEEWKSPTAEVKVEKITLFMGEKPKIRLAVKTEGGSKND